MTTTGAANQVREHLRALYGGYGGDAPGWLAVFTLPDRRTRWFAGDDLFGETPEVIAALGAEQHVYHGMALQSTRATEGRGDAAHALAVPGVWFDLDVRGPSHASDQLPASYDEALDFLASLPLQPSRIIDSGGGLQVHWLFRELQVFASPADRQIAETLSRRVQAGIITRGKARGWALDDTRDLARILRLPGTLNWKTTPPRPVRTIYEATARYLPRDVVAFCLRPPATPKPRVIPTSATPADDDRRVRAYLDKVGSRTEGSRDNALFQIAVWLCNDFELPNERALGYLQEWNAANRPPLPDRVLVEKLRHVRGSARRPAGCARRSA